MKKITFLLFFLICLGSFAQVINEVDGDTPGTDTEEFLEIKHTPSTTFSKIAIAFHNGGTATQSVYGTIDLDGKTTDANGFYVIGQEAVTQKNELLEVSIQNGADAVALYSYEGDFSSFDVANATLITSVVHHTGDLGTISDNEQALLDAFGPGYDEGENGQKDTQSIQRKDDGTYGTANPTPGAENVFPDPVDAIEVSSISELRTGATDGTEYTLTSEAVLVYQQSYRNQKVIQDATGGILIDDSAEKITTSYNDYDGVTGITGILSSYQGLLQFVPTDDPGPASSSDNSPTITTLTFADFANGGAEAYESQLVKVESVLIASDDETVTTFTNGKVYTLTDQGNDTFKMRLNFYNFDGSIEVPNDPVSIVGIVGERSDIGLHLAPRDIMDVDNGSLNNNKNIFSEFKVYPNPVSNGTVTITSQFTEDITATVFDILGKEVINERVNNNMLDVSQLNKGIYLMKLTQNGASATQKLVIK